MSTLQPPDSHHLSAAVGWMELGNLIEAGAELGSISPENQSHPDLLEVRWSLCAHERQWDAALALAERLVSAAPERCSGWIDRSYSLHELKRTEEAREKLLPAAARFPDVTTIPYNLACYESQLGRLDRARRWLTLAMSVGKRDAVLAQALKDSDLRLLWPELTRLNKGPGWHRPSHE
jgi:Flp pilus assembly protein TadD